MTPPHHLGAIAAAKVVSGGALPPGSYTITNYAGTYVGEGADGGGAVSLPWTNPLNALGVEDASWVAANNQAAGTRPFITYGGFDFASDGFDAGDTLTALRIVVGAHVAVQARRPTVEVRPLVNGVEVDPIQSQTSSISTTATHTFSFPGVTISELLDPDFQVMFVLPDVTSTNGTGALRFIRVEADVTVV